jgi:hypothetical protein
VFRNHPSHIQLYTEHEIPVGNKMIGEDTQIQNAPIRLKIRKSLLLYYLRCGCQGYSPVSDELWCGLREEVGDRNKRNLTEFHENYGILLKMTVVSHRGFGFLQPERNQLCTN